MFKFSDIDQTIKIFNFRADTQEFIGSSDAYIPAHTGLPAYSTTVSPPDIPEGNAAIFDGSEWRLEEDHRGKVVYLTATGEGVEIVELGPLPDGVTMIAPDGAYMRWTGAEWVHDADEEKAALVQIAAAERAGHLAYAAGRVAILQDAVDLDMATDDEKARLLEWKKYRVLLNRVDATAAPDIVWPAPPAE